MSMMFSGSDKDTWSEGKWEWVESENEHGKFSFAVFCPSPPSISADKNKKEWVGLNPKEITDLSMYCQGENPAFFALEVEAKLKEKNS